ncbi:DUF2637 domain-containing protein [Streptomyces goshikiensis]|uniref:DUF2637 domain-containing protein n=1 Tax=Streptomyces goshikiensis TaxID=1942 RepID=UPI0033EECBAB
MKKLAAALTPAQLKSIDRTLSGGTWTITFGAVLFSVLTVTPLVQRVTAEAWDWTAPILPIVVDAAVVIVIRMDATISRLGEAGGRWPGILRWLTGCMTLALNIGDSALKGDTVGVAVHSVAPLLLIVTAEAALAYRHAISRALDRVAREQREEEERKHREHLDREQRDRADREAREQSEREERERTRLDREQSERAAREHQLQRDREQREADREQRDWTAAQERERLDREQREQRERLDREQAERREQEERERQEREQREAREQAERDEAARLEQERRDEEERAREQQRQERQARREQAAATVREHPAKPVREHPTRQAANTPANTSKDKLPEQEARAAIVAGVAANTGVRELSRRTGWSVAWVSERMAETREQQPGEHPAVEAAAGEQPGGEHLDLDPANTGDLVGSAAQ